MFHTLHNRRNVDDIASAGDVEEDRKPAAAAEEEEEDPYV